MVKTRLYLDDGKINPLIDTSQLKQQMHALFANWVYAGYHERDFVEAIEHTATWVYSQHLLMGAPSLLGENAEAVAVNPGPDQRCKGAIKPRFYDQDGDLNPEITSQPLQASLASCFVAWCNRGYHQRDFIQAAKDEALGIYYSYDCSTSLQGLGGGPTADEYLARAFGQSCSSEGVAP